MVPQGRRARLLPLPSSALGQRSYLLIPSTARKYYLALSECQVSDVVDLYVRRYENLAPKVYRKDSLDSLNYMAEKGVRAVESCRPGDFV